MILKIYILGLVIMLIWWVVLANYTFNESMYNSTDESGKESLEELQDLLNHFSLDNPQKAFVIISLIVCIIWPIFVPYIILKNILK
jgi:threonine/homoserine/homoserine lactone efflux protein